MHNIIPTLIIGLGGQGRRIAEHLKVRLIERYGVDGFDKHIRFFCADTNVTEKFGAPFPNEPDRPVLEVSGGELFSLSGTPIEELKRGSNPLGKELPPELYSDQIFQGAQQIRRLGRVALWSHYSDFRTALTKVITELLRDERNVEPEALRRSEDKRLEVYIACSICGGTGSGTFIDIAYIVRDIMTQHKQIALNVNGVLLLPEVLNEVRGDPYIRIRANAYASLLDLEYYSQPTEVNNPLYRSPDVGETGSFTIAASPFSYCYLVQGNDRYYGGAQLIPLIGDALEIMICTGAGSKVDGALDNIRPKFVNYTSGFRTLYSAFGIGRIIIPEKRLQAVRANQLQRMLINRALLGHSPTDGTVEGASTREARTRLDDDRAAKAAAELWAGMQTVIENALDAQRDEIQRLSFNQSEGVKWLTEALGFLPAVAQHTRDLSALLREAAEVTAARLYALSALRHSFTTQTAPMIADELRTAIIARFDADWQRGGGLVWLQALIQRLIVLIEAKRQGFEQNSPGWERLADEIGVQTQNALDEVDNKMPLGFVGRMFGSGKARASAVQGARQLRDDYQKLWRAERTRALDTCYAFVLSALRATWLLKINRATGEWQRIASQLENERQQQRMRFSSETARVILPAQFDEATFEQQSLDAFTEEIARFDALFTRRGADGSLSRTLLIEEDGATVRALMSQWTREDAASSQDKYSVIAILNPAFEAAETDPAEKRKDPDNASQERMRIWREMYEDATPLLSYSTARFALDAEDVSVFNTVFTLAELPPGLTNVAATNDQEPHNLVFLKTKHGIPLVALDNFMVYKNAYRDAIKGPNPIFHITERLENEPFDPSSKFFSNANEPERQFALALATKALAIRSRTTTMLKYETEFADALKQAQSSLHQELLAREREISTASTFDPNARTTDMRAYKLYALLKEQIARLDPECGVSVEDWLPNDKPFAEMHAQCTVIYSKNDVFPERVILFQRAVAIYLSPKKWLSQEEHDGLIQEDLRKFLEGRLDESIDPNTGKKAPGDDWTESKFSASLDPNNAHLTRIELRLCRHVLAALRAMNRKLRLTDRPDLLSGYWLSASAPASTQGDSTATPPNETGLQENSAAEQENAAPPGIKS